MQGLPGCASFSNTCLGVLHSYATCCWLGFILKHMRNLLFPDHASFANTCATCCFLITLHSQTRMPNSFITRKVSSDGQRFLLRRNFSDVLALGEFPRGSYSSGASQISLREASQGVSLWMRFSEGRHGGRKMRRSTSTKMQQPQTPGSGE